MVDRLSFTPLQLVGPWSTHRGFHPGRPGLDVPGRRFRQCLDSSRTWSSLGPTAFLAFFCGLQHRPPRAWSSRRASSRTELLVDADSSSIEEIEQAISLLEAQGHAVKTTIFAEPERRENRNWTEFLLKPNVSFEAVGRYQKADPNDEAIECFMRKLSGRPGLYCIALLTRDTDFIPATLDLQASGTHICVLVCALMHSVSGKYKAAGVKTFTLNAPERRSSRVRAILHDTGDGSVELADPWTSFEQKEKSLEVMKFLEDFGYRDGTGFTIQAAAKFWFANSLGSLVVFPSQLATISLSDLVRSHGTRGWERYSGELAYILPISNKGKKRDTRVLKYGSSAACAVYQGGGPFILKKSADLATQVLKRLGYLDDDLNANLTEALRCFVNAAENKKVLRKFGILPDTMYKGQCMIDHLNTAFCSHITPGTWQMMTSQEALRLEVGTILEKAKILSKADRGCSRNKFFNAMKDFARNRHLPIMKTFNGQAFQIRRDSVKLSPCKRHTIEIEDY
ncbi:Phosphopantothenate--cysteine ligase 1 [Durusdinium trenchii]|uniref:Phosphopantothenate--cysteine ligase 1 n=1 Tax=Durusdinium trenchii TaxID=1381693 RepID=A0ABP0HBN0_9DINO